ncbi:MAG TPA: substrate-binding domain-containing protein [Pseudolabrys sp.]|jgi:molybdate transport system substrate-binding protein
MNFVSLLLRAGAAVLILLASVFAKAAEIRVTASPAFSAVFALLGPRFERATGHTLSIQYGLVAAQKQQIAAGTIDIAIVPSPVLDDAIEQGRISAATRPLLARVILGVGVRAGARKPDLTSLESFKRTLLDAKSVSYVTDEPTGKRIGKAFEGLGIGDAMKVKTRSEESTARVWHDVANGDVEMGFGFTSNALSARGVELAGAFPPELQYSVVMAAGVANSARQPDAAKALISYLLTAEAVAVMKTKGLEPATP